MKIPKKSFGDLKPKSEKKASIGIKDPDINEAPYSKEIDMKRITELAFESAMSPIEVVTTPFNPTSPRLMAVFELLTNKSFPRKKGKGKSTKIVMLDAIIMAAINKKLILQEEKDAKSRGN